MPAAFLASAIILAAAAAPSVSAQSGERTAPAGAPTIVIHGGAGALSPGRYTAAQEAEYLSALSDALDAGYAVLEAGGTALDAVEAAVVLMEDSPLFNAGKGAVFTRDGKNELDASIMDGATLKAGAVAGVTRIRNPVLLARAVMEKSPHVMLARDGAEDFAKEQGFDFVGRKYFRTERRWNDLQEALEKERKEAASAQDWKYGTVGAVALDANGDLAAATSTGGMLMKRWGRVGDTPVIGAGTYADNRSCAVSSTGWGEYFIRLAVARDICAQMEYAGKSAEDAAHDVIHNRLQKAGGDGGVIVLGRDGAYAMPFNSAGMFRGVRQGDVKKVAIYGD